MVIYEFLSWFRYIQVVIGLNEMLTVTKEYGCRAMAKKCKVSDNIQFSGKKIKSPQILIYNIILTKIYNKFIECNFVAFFNKITSDNTFDTFLPVNNCGTPCVRRRCATL